MRKWTKMRGRATCIGVWCVAGIAALYVAYVLGRMSASPWQLGDKVASGVFYFGRPGLEMKSDCVDWSGPSPIWCFKRMLWERRGENFENDVVKRVLRLRRTAGQGPSDEKIAKAAVRTMTFSRAPNAGFCRVRLTVASCDGDIAAKTVEAAFDCLQDREMSERQKERIVEAGHMAFVILDERKRLEKVQNESERTSLTNSIANLETSLAELWARRLGGTIWFKAMEVPTNAVERVTPNLMLRLKDEQDVFESM